MKKIKGIILVILCILSLTGCVNNEFVKEAGYINFDAFVKWDREQAARLGFDETELDSLLGSIDNFLVSELAVIFGEKGASKFLELYKQKMTEIPKPEVKIIPKDKPKQEVEKSKEDEQTIYLDSRKLRFEFNYLDGNAIVSEFKSRLEMEIENNKELTEEEIEDLKVQIIEDIFKNVQFSDEKNYIEIRFAEVGRHWAPENIYDFIILSMKKALNGNYLDINAFEK